MTKLNEETTLIRHLTEEDKNYLKQTVRTYLTRMSEKDFKNAIDSLSNYSEKAKKIWDEHLGVVNIAVNAILSKLGLSNLELQKTTLEEKLKESEKYQLEKLQKIALKMNFSSIYVLIDRIDESDITGNDASLSSMLIEPLLKDLDLLEMRGYAFKFFLWDKLEPYCLKFIRTDRLSYFTLNWENNELEKMLSKRLEAYSSNRIKDFSKIVNYNLPVDINSLIIRFAQKSPRNVIRIIQDIVSEQIEINNSSRKISMEAVERGINSFSKKSIREIIVDKNVIKDLRKIGQVEFTNNYLANNILRCSQESSKLIINKWENLGVVENIGKEGRNKSVNNYCINDIIVAKYILLEMSLENFLNKKYQICPRCNVTLLRDWDRKSTKTCHNCSIDISYSDKIIQSKQKTILDYSGQKSLYDF